MNRRDIFKGLGAAVAVLVAPWLTEDREQRVIRFTGKHRDLLRVRIAEAQNQMRIDVARNVWWNTSKPDLIVADKDFKRMFDEATQDTEWTWTELAVEKRD